METKGRYDQLIENKCILEVEFATITPKVNVIE